MYDCPKCGDSLADEAVICNHCKWVPPGLQPTAPKGLSERGLAAAKARRRFEQHPPSSAERSMQQWYNVCKFFPTVARLASAHSHRPLAEVGPDNPLDKTATLGPLLRGFRPPVVREPGEEG